MKKILFVSFLVLVTLFSTNSAYAGWEKSGSSWYYKGSSGSYHSGWLYDGGTWYYLDPNGVMKTGWMYENGTWYYLHSSGAMATGWTNVGGTWYYLQGSGAMKTGWLNQGGTWYYLHSNGAMATGWILDGGTWYYLKSSGAMTTGWLLDGNEWYYLEGNGAMKTGWLTLDGATYYLNSSGAMLSGQQMIDGKAYVFSSSGALTDSKVTGWFEVGSNIYYFHSDGTKAVGWIQIPNSQGIMSWYYFNHDGTLRKGWLQEGASWYYLRSDGTMQTDWATIGGKEYYFDQSGVMNTETLTLDGKKYKFFASGALMSTISYTSYDITLDNMVNIQHEVNAKTDKYRNDPSYVHKDYITLLEDNPNRGKVNYPPGLNVREGTSTTSRILGGLKYEDEVTIIATHGDWYEIVYGPWKNATHDDIREYANPTNFEDDDFQFLNLSQHTGVSTSELNNKILAGKGILNGKAQAFIDGSKTYHVNELYLISHALHETGHGTSPLSNGSIEVGQLETNKYVSFHSGTAYIAEYHYDESNEKWFWDVTEDKNFDRSKAENIKQTYNMFGIGAVDSAAYTLGSVTAYRNDWFTPEDAIIGGAKYIGESYINHSTYKQDTMYKMRWNPATPGTHQYATDIGWATKQVGDLAEMYQLLDYYTLYFDVPVFK